MQKCASPAGLDFEPRQCLTETENNLEHQAEHMERVLEYCWNVRDNFKRENPGFDPSSYEDLQDHEPMFYQPCSPLPTLAEYREVNLANVNTLGSRMLHPEGY